MKLSKLIEEENTFTITRHPDVVLPEFNIKFSKRKPLTSKERDSRRAKNKLARKNRKKN